MVILPVRCDRNTPIGKKSTENLPPTTQAGAPPSSAGSTRRLSQGRACGTRPKKGTMAPLSGHTAIVTGSGRNIGRAIVLALAAAGADVVVNGHRDRDRVDAVVAEVAALKTGAAAIGVMADVSDPDQVANLVKTSADAFGR